MNGEFTQRGGQEFANHALAKRLADSGREITLIAHAVDPNLASQPNVKSVLVGRPFRSDYLGERALEWAAKREYEGRRRLCRTILVGNGGNCPEAEVSWAHFVHAAWRGELCAAPLHVRVLHWLKKQDALLRERRAFSHAALVISNSERTSAELEERLGVQRERIVRIWFGTDLSPAPQRGGRSKVAPELLFLGALGWDSRKGLDIALRAFATLADEPDFRHRLVVAGAGSDRPWKRLARELGILTRVDFRAYVEDVPSLLAAADLLVCPARYEPYGLAIQEAIMAGVPPLVAAGNTGIVDRFPSGLSELVVTEPMDPGRWTDAVHRSLQRLEELRARTRDAARLLAGWTWRDFADEFIAAVESRLVGAEGQTR